MQVRSALSGNQLPVRALADINQTADHARLVTNQILALAKFEQLRQQLELKTFNQANVMRTVALDLSALMADKNFDFAIMTVSAPMAVHEWMLTGLTRNQLQDAIKHTPDSGNVTVRMCAAVHMRTATFRQWARHWQTFATALVLTLFPQPASPGDHALDWLSAKKLWRCWAEP